MISVTTYMASQIVPTVANFATLDGSVATKSKPSATRCSIIATPATHFATESRPRVRVDSDPATWGLSPEGADAIVAALFPGNVALHGVNATQCAYSGTLHTYNATLTRDGVSICAINVMTCDKIATA